MFCKFVSSFLILMVLGVASSVQQGTSGVYNQEPRVTVKSVVNMTPEMQKDAIEFLKTAYYVTSGSIERLDTWKNLVVARYPSNNWQVVQDGTNTTVDRKPVRSIELEVGEDSYLLIATK